MLKKFIQLCKQSQSELKKSLYKWLKSMGYTPINKKGYLYAKGTLPVCITAHLDTVHKQPVAVIEITENGNAVSSPQGIGGDDRCGVFMIQKIVENGYRPTILFCEDEEVGGVGSDIFCRSPYISDLSEMKFIIELDRKGSHDIVFYEDENESFHKFCTKTTGYKEAFGTFSDISNICPDCGVSGVNVSCGYYKAHTLDEYVVMSEMLDSIKAVEKLLDKANDCQQFEYTCVPKHRYYSYGYGGCIDEFYLCAYDSRKGDIIEDYYIASSYEEAIGRFLIDNPHICYADVSWSEDIKEAGANET